MDKDTVLEYIKKYSSSTNKESIIETLKKNGANDILINEAYQSYESSSELEKPVKSKKIWIILLIFVVFIALGGTAYYFSDSGDEMFLGTPQDELMKVLTIKKDLKESSIVYSAEFPVTSEVIPNIDMDIKIVQNNENTKTITEISFSGELITVENYLINGNNYQCSNQGSFGSSKNETVCSLNIDSQSNINFDIFDLDLYKQLIDENILIVESNGTKTIQDIKTTCYTLKITDVEKYNEFLTTSSMLSEISKEEVSNQSIINCYAKDGRILEISAYSNNYPKINEETKAVKIFTIIATKVSDEIEEIILPVNFLLIDSAVSGTKQILLFKSINEGSSSATLKLTDYYTDEEKTIDSLPMTSYEKDSVNSIIFEINNVTNKGDIICFDEECNDISSLSYGVDEIEKYTCLLNIDDVNKCNLDSVCTFKNGYCTYFSCIELDDENSCLSNDLCYWWNTTNGACMKKSCTKITNENDCTSSKLKCEWNYDYQNKGYCWRE